MLYLASYSCGDSYSDLDYTSALIFCLDHLCTVPLVVETLKIWKWSTFRIVETFRAGSSEQHVAMDDTEEGVYVPVRSTLKRGVNHAHFTRLFVSMSMSYVSKLQYKFSLIFVVIGDDTSEPPPVYRPASE